MTRRERLAEWLTRCAYISVSGKRIVARRVLIVNRGHNRKPRLLLVHQ